jgi:PAS domain S-box-containing protein
MATPKSRLAGKGKLTSEAEETLQAIRQGFVDAFLIDEPEGHRVYTLEGADLPYSVLVEKMQQGAAMLDEQGVIIYCNESMARLAGKSGGDLIGLRLENLIHDNNLQEFQSLLRGADFGLEDGEGEAEMQLVRADGERVPVNVSVRLLSSDKSAIGVLIADLTVQKQQVELAARLQLVQDEERRRLARELHDSVGQMVIAIALNMSMIEGEAHKLSPKVAELLTQNSTIVSQINDQIRTISHLLHPPLLDEVGLALALRCYVEGFAERSRIQTTVEIPEEIKALPREVEIAVFRFVQECLTNVHRHSGSSTCVVRVDCENNNLRVQVRDAGRGIHEGKLGSLVSLGGVGIRGLQERFRQLGGSLKIESSAGGTVVEACISMAPATS